VRAFWELLYAELVRAEAVAAHPARPDFTNLAAAQHQVRRFFFFVSFFLLFVFFFKRIFLKI
jgi:type VI protein secretion system component VasF